ncbi:inositol-pentakisphosphate 2-kinase isoform X1 [Drosophila takahashii]|uniref:inositol-pentakisphosphate 2-kinase isoform X1 n=2 Tax=Drosophila takahashii TaxID=29030 RepID=UPI001CF8EF73|nr:inositol-pentakisphosphate 2-kinase [Drosophila takahashii]
MTAARETISSPGSGLGIGFGFGSGEKLRLEPQLQPHRVAKNLHALLDLPAAMELRQIELIYRAEGNANLVLALPQFKKVLRLPKMISSRRRPEERNERNERSERDEPQEGEVAQPEGQGESSAEEGAEKVPRDAASAGPSPPSPSQSLAGDLTMPDFMAYIGIMRRLLGNEFVCGADIVAIPKEDDRFWINEHIRAQRPVSRLDKEFVGPFGLLLPDVTQLPATFDVLLANLQAKGTTGDETGGAGATRTPLRRLGDTYAIEIKPKQGWLQLASDVNDLFDLMPPGAETKPKDQGEQKEQEQKDKCWCRFCSMQLLKLHNGKIKRLGHYCPLDLFSGAPSRMLDALDALLACPQNNLRVFQNGNLIYGDHANSISFDELHSRVFPGEIMVLIKHLLVACLLREYKQPESNRPESPNQKQNQNQTLDQEQLNQSRVSIAATETKAGAAGIGAANVVLPFGGVAAASSSSVVTAGQSSTRTRAAAATATTQRYTKVDRMETATTSGSQLTGNVLATATVKATATETATRTETKTEPETQSRNENQDESRNRNRNQNQNEPANQTQTQTQAQINKAEIFRLPRNCVLQKILNLQLLVKRHFDFMWHSGYSDHSEPTYNALRGLLAEERKGAAFEPDEEQAYMLGATALDCSIMLTFQEIEIECESDCPAGQSDFEALQPWSVALLGHHFLTKLCVLDLDPKPDSHFHKFMAQTREIEKCRRALN